ncbi:MAG: ribosome-associated translation inhibitor RaiA [Oscillospiraceae bacterium]|jgi:putative sigma-54 modulation protein|nr:ribosome-associated translation inhibitor RaiA [Oscillospiraceae bacterium]MBP1555452.1 ribosome-associated translation inhibitor RaiA [Oscillospiraceae bacterium]MBQ5341675.1 ribosome-associated translation inhibitor RaiA [Oscillospiraceae bacterium]MBQ5342099.1 ribosome-associated translation inhibitor RaiA [Oscillospiraceae bacterium]MBR5065837.1 ribosome-associated translation inhibitor RaiA [Oscillospiraceae bacterium]
MKVKTSGHGLNLRQSFIDNANKRLQKFDRFFNEEADAAVNVDLEKDRYTVEITVKSRGFFYRTERTSTDLDSAFREAVDLMMRQIVKNKSKLGNRVKVKEVELAGEELDLTAPDETEEEQEYHIAREKRFVIEPMSEQEAILQMNMLGHTFFMFRNADTNELNIVYRRHDDSYGLLVPVN